MSRGISELGVVAIRDISVLISILLLATVFAIVDASVVEKSFETGGYFVSYQLSSGEAEPGSELTLNVTIDSKVLNYDFELWIEPSEPLSVTKDGYIHYSELSVGERRKETFVVNVPASVEEDETYVIHLSTQSHDNLPGLLGRLGDPVEYFFDTTDNIGYALETTIVLRAGLVISDISIGAPTISSIKFTFTVAVENDGTGLASNVEAGIDLPEGLSLAEENEIILLGDIDPNGQKTTTWTLVGEAGTYTVEVIISASNSDSVSTTKDVTVTHWLWVVGPIVAILIFLVLVVGKMKDWW